MHTPGLTVISRSSPNYSINGRLQRQIGVLYRKHGFEKCPNHGLFWAGSPRWTTIEDRTKTVLLVVELKEKDIQFWWKMDDEVRKILDEHELTERGVCLRYYMFWSGNIERERRQHSDAGLHRLAADDVHGANDELDELYWTTPPRRFSSLFRSHPELEPQQDLLVGPGPTDATSQDEHSNTAVLAEQFEPSTPEDLPNLIPHAERQSLRLPLISQSANFGEVLHVEHAERRSSSFARARRAFMQDYEQAVQARRHRSPRGWLDDVYWPARRSWT